MSTPRMHKEKSRELILKGTLPPGYSLVFYEASNDGGFVELRKAILGIFSKKVADRNVSTNLPYNHTFTGKQKFEYTANSLITFAQQHYTDNSRINPSKRWKPEDYAADFEAVQKPKSKTEQSNKPYIILNEF